MKKVITLIIGLFFSLMAFACDTQDRPINNENTDNNPPKKELKMKIIIGENTFIANLATTISAEAFKNKLPLTLEMSDYGGFEKIATIDKLPTANKLENNLEAGDIMLYSGNTFVIFYAPHGGYSYMRIGKIENPQGLKKALGSGNVTIRFELHQ